jgi:hypothetical protein
MSAFTYSIGPDTRIFFPDKPSEAIRALLKRTGFRWSPSAACWYRRSLRGAADFLPALDRKMNPRRPDGACWRCHAPEVFFRPRGAATPVYCDACHEALNAPPAPDRSDLDNENRCRKVCSL